MPSAKISASISRLYLFIYLFIGGFIMYYSDRFNFVNLDGSPISDYTFAAINDFYSLEASSCGSDNPLYPNQEMALTNLKNATKHVKSLDAAKRIANMYRARHNCEVLVCKTEQPGSIRYHNRYPVFYAAGGYCSSNTWTFDRGTGCPLADISNELWKYVNDYNESTKIYLKKEIETRFRVKVIDYNKLPEIKRCITISHFMESDDYFIVANKR